MNVNGASLLITAVVGCSASLSRADILVSWGSNFFGELGDGTGLSRSSPGTVSGLSSEVTHVAAGGLGWSHGLAVQNGVVFSWGSNQFGQLGVNIADAVTVPMRVNGLGDNVSAIAAGQWHSMALAGGGVYTWGSNGSGELGDNTTENKTTPIALGTLSSGVTAITAGSSHNLVIQNGGLFAWGWNGRGQIGNGLNPINQLLPVAVIGMESGVTAIAAGCAHSLAVKNGVVYQWGETNYVPLKVDGLSEGITDIAAGGVLGSQSDHFLAIKDGDVYAWGANGSGQLGLGDTTFRETPTIVPGLSNIVMVEAGGSSSFALAADGSLWVWGSNGVGTLGLGDLDGRLSPTQLVPPEGFRFTSVSSGNSHTLATLAAIPEPSVIGVLVICTLGLQRRRTFRHTVT